MSRALTTRAGACWAPADTPGVVSGGLAAAAGGQPGKAKQVCSPGRWHSTETRSQRKRRGHLLVPLAAGWEPSCGRISPASAGLWSRRTTARLRPEAPLGPSGPTPAPGGSPRAGCAAPRPGGFRRSPRRRPQHLSGQSVSVLHHPQGKKQKSSSWCSDISVFQPVPLVSSWHWLLLKEPSSVLCAL